MTSCDAGDTGMKKRHSLEPNKYPYVSPSMINIDDDDKVDISDTARYPLVKIHGLSLSVCLSLYLSVRPSVYLSVCLASLNSQSL